MRPASDQRCRPAARGLDFLQKPREALRRT